MAPRKKKEATEEPVKETPVKIPEGTHASVLTKHGQHMRTYTREVHGESFVDLAHEFAAQHPESDVRVH